MKLITLPVLLAVGFFAVLQDAAWSQPLTVTTIAGQLGTFADPSFTNYDHGIGTNAIFGYPSSLVADRAGNLYVLDGSLVSKISPDHSVAILAGSPYYQGYLDATGTNALFSEPTDIAVDKNGYIYVADSGNYVIRKISPSGMVTTLAGDGNSGYQDSADGPPEFMYPTTVTVDLSGNVYVMDSAILRKITAAGVVSTLAGGGASYGDGHGTNVNFLYVSSNVEFFGLAVDAGGTIYVATGYGIRKVAPNGDVTTWVGTTDYNYIGVPFEGDGLLLNAGFDGALHIALDHGGGAYVTDAHGATIRHVASSGAVSTVAGLAYQQPTNNFNDGVGSDARFYLPFGIAVDPIGNVDITDAPDYTILKGVPPSLSAISSFGESPGVTPVRSNNPWQFTAHFTDIVSDLRLRVQSTTTTNSEASWVDLPGNPFMSNVDGNWTLNITDVPTGTTDVPTGSRFFRVIAAAPGYFDSDSVTLGPENVLDGIAPLSFFHGETVEPYQNGVLWTFTTTESSVISDLRLRVQATTTPTNQLSWTDLPGGGQMGHHESTWTLDTTNVPIGNEFFRIVASAPTYVDRISPVGGPYNIVAKLPDIWITNSVIGFHVKDMDAVAEMQQAGTVYAQAVGAASVLYSFTGNIKQYIAALTLASDQYSSVVLSVGPGQTLINPAINVGPRTSVELKGTVKTDFSVGVPLIGQDGLITQDGAGIMYDQKAAQMITQDGGTLVSHGGGSLVSNGGGSLVSNGGGSFTGKAVAAATGASKTPLIPSSKTPPTQPTFTGQMTIDGNYSQFSGATLSIAIAGTNTLSDGAQQFDQLVVTGTANLLGGTIAFGLFNPDDQTNQDNVFQPPDGAAFDVVVASNIVVGAVQFVGPIWGDGQFFTGSVVIRPDGLQAVRLVATHIPPKIALQNFNSALQLIYATNYTGYTIESSSSLSSSNWTAFSTGTNVVTINPTNACQYFRLSKP